ncbi:Undecaprenyl-phosphate alpha-N-acetylglucosaminyl 1-phosphate transferase [hydrothermal vent metagenome]|uniref:Undecaprenyl-phosphate alpha-N-acetylglucosaminyl 1-phosphate transferase n=1 Tax=hydrothermal vent metagenome TaxID=652676 RepID=A0A3B0U271_9ZZZZ
MKIVFVIVAFAISFFLALISIPPIIKVSNAKSLFALSGGRNVHTRAIPTLGGIAIFIGFMISTLIVADLSFLSEVKLLLVAVIMMFFIGLKDDILIMAAWKKLVVQVLAALLLIVLADIRFTSLHGILGIGKLNYVFSLGITLFIIIVIINAFNLIDGIDGLASGIAIQASTVLGIWFLISGHLNYSILSFALAGSLCAFFLYNVFGHKNKIFLGDTGALITGVIISVLIIKINEYNILHVGQFTSRVSPAISFAIIIAPLIDTLRVFTIRIIQKKSPFSPDKNHIHHHLLKLYNNHHLKATITIVLINSLFTAFAFWLAYIGVEINILFLTIFVLGIYIAYIPMLLNRSNAGYRLGPSLIKTLKGIIL